MEKLVVVIMGQNCERFIDMALESIKDADAIVYCDGGSTDSTLQKVADFETEDCLVDRIFNKYKQKDKGMNGKQRNFYLEYVKDNYPDYWCLTIDADEVVEDLSKIRKYIKTQAGGVHSIKMRHLIGDLAHEDATQPEHYVLNRLFKISDAIGYLEVEHPVLEGKFYNKTDCTTIWHLAYIPNMWEIKKRYDNHVKKSNMHSPDFLRRWYKAHLFGQYPKKEFNAIELPKIILDKFEIDKDELYFENRGLEMKHFGMVKQWYEFFKHHHSEPFDVLEFGCGRGPYGYVFDYLEIGCYSGIELSKYAVDNKLTENVYNGDILKYNGLKCNNLVLAIDVLEHLKYDDLSQAIDNMINHMRDYILVSVPFKYTPNCDADPTHIIKEDRDWWVEKFTSKGLKEVEVPSDWLFREQLLIFQK